MTTTDEPDMVAAFLAGVRDIDLSRFPVPLTVEATLRGPAIEIHLTMMGKDRDTGTPIDLHSVDAVSIDVVRAMVGQTFAEFLPEFVRGALRRFLLHEVDECLFYQAKRVRDPHDNSWEKPTPARQAGHDG